MNIKKLRLEKGLSQEYVAKYLGVTQQAYANYERGARQADYSTLEKLSTFFDVSIDYLLDDSLDAEETSHARKMVKKLAEERDINISDIENKLGVNYATFRSWYNGIGDKFNNASQLLKISDLYDVSIGFLLGIEDQDKKENTASEIKSNAIFLNDSKIRMIPLFETVSAGFGATALEEIVGYIPCYIENDYEAENSMCLKVWGDSMSPKIESGDIIQVLKQTSVDSGSIAVVLIDGEEGLVKRVVYGKTWIELHSLNPNYPVQRFDKAEVLRVSVVGLVKKIIKDI